MPRNMETPIGVLPIEIDPENASIEFEKLPLLSSQDTSLYPSFDLTGGSYLNFSGIAPLVHPSKPPIYINVSLGRNSLRSTQTSWRWAQNHVHRICEDINTANSSVLQRVKGIGRAKAQAIIDYREQHGPFQSLDELTNVRGIGPATVENFRTARFCVQRANGATEAESNQANSEAKDSTATSNNCNDVNMASATDLQRVSRIGVVKAQAIIADRNQNGPFRTLDELTRVRGIGPATIENFREAGFCVTTSSDTGNHSDTPAQASSNNSTPQNSNCQNINTANAAELQRVNRIGAVRAQAIIDYRNQNGPFRTLNELTRVKGIGPATLENFRRSGFCAPTTSSIPTDSTNNQLYAQLNPPDTIDKTCEDINTANSETLQRVLGIGSAKAKAIIAHRNQFGSFASLDGLLDVKGIDPDTFQQFQTSGFCIDPFSTVVGSPDTSPRSISSVVPYHRSLYGGWLDTDNDCQNTRHEILIAESRVEVRLDETGCFVVSGEWHDPYLDSLITDPSMIDIDHFIPLAEVHRSGGAKWDDSTRYAFGNDLSENGVLIPVSFSANRSKGDRDLANWLPPNSAYHCQYVDRWVALKQTWKLTLDYAEHQAVMNIQDNC